MTECTRCPQAQAFLKAHPKQKTRHALSAGLAALALVMGLSASAAQAADFDWKKHSGKTITFLANNNPVLTAVQALTPEFTKETGIIVKYDIFQEQQMRQRLTTSLQSKSSDVDIFMSLQSREGLLYSNAGWYTDLNPYLKDATSPDYDPADISPALIKGATFGGKLTGMPVQIEGPVMYYRTDIFKDCNVAEPKTLEDLLTASKALKACKPDVVPFDSRGLKPAIAFTFSVFLHNLGGEYIVDGKSALSSPIGLKALELYSTLLKDYGPEGVTNYSFYQISTLYREGRAAMAFEASNELSSVMDGGARLKDTAIIPLPAGAAPDGRQMPTVHGWSLAISPFSKEKDAAWYFVQWMSSKPQALQMALAGVAPARTSVNASPEYQQWIKAEPVRQQWVDALDVLAQKGVSDIGPQVRSQPEARDFLGQAVNEIILGQKSVKEAAAAADKGIDAIIAKENR